MSQKRDKTGQGVCPKCGAENPETAKFCNTCGAKLQVAVVKEEQTLTGSGKCPKCGSENPAKSMFCNTCGSRLQVVKGGFDGLVSLNAVAAVYSLFSAAFYGLILEPLFLGLYLAAGVLGLYVAYALNAGKIRRWTKFVSVAMIAAGLVVTVLLGWVILVINPGWMIFVAVAWKLWQDRNSL